MPRIKIYNIVLAFTDHPTFVHLHNGTGVVIETSANVFHENLLNTRNLETTQYITDVTQATDFNWERDSGLMVNIGIYNVHLLPSYKDFDHEENSDNKFMSQNPDLLANQSFQAVRKSFCRLEFHWENLFLG